MLTLTDQLGRLISLNQPPKRIISLVPSQTELLFYLGLDAEIVGITKFCTHPATQTASKLKIGGTKQLSIPLIRSLNPDLIIANKEENDRKQVEELMAAYPTYISDPDNLLTALQMITDIGVLVGYSNTAQALSASISKAFGSLSFVSSKLRVAYLIWRKPYMVAGSGTFINDMLRRCGFINVFPQLRYPEITLGQLLEAKPEVILLSSEPYPFKQQHADELALTLPNSLIKLVDGEMFSWYGSRLLHAPQYFMQLINSLNHTDI
jgi:ABC-type Fe3+-hydroxamate transport system substrate-binding protein